MQPAMCSDSANRGLSREGNAPPSSWQLRRAGSNTSNQKLNNGPIRCTSQSFRACLYAFRIYKHLPAPPPTMPPCPKHKSPNLGRANLSSVFVYPFLPPQNKKSLNQKYHRAGHSLPRTERPPERAGAPFSHVCVRACRLIPSIPRLGEAALLQLAFGLDSPCMPAALRLRQFSVLEPFYPMRCCAGHDLKLLRGSIAWSDLYATAG